MGRKNKYETHVRPRLKEITKWTETMTDEQIANRLGIARSSFEKYKSMYPELVEAIRQGHEGLCQELKGTLKKKALGYYYKETKTTQRKENGKTVVVVETYEKYAQPDTGAIHLLLKNHDDTWRNDDKTTMDLKKEQVEIAKKKAEENAW